MTTDLMSLLLVHFLCNAQAGTTQMSVSEAHFCSAQFETLKIELHPGIMQTQFSKLGTRERARVSIEAYAFYRTWLEENPDTVRKLRDASELLISDRD